MGRPLLLFNLFDLANPSFEDDSPGAGTPSGWTEVSGDSYDSEIVTSPVHSAGEGLPSRQAWRLAAPTGNDYPDFRQRFSLSNIPASMRGTNGLKVAFLGMQYAEDVYGFNGGEFWLYFYKGGDSTPGSGTLISSNRDFISAGSRVAGNWVLSGRSGYIPEDAEWVDFAIDYDPDEGAAGASHSSWFDRCFAGILLDFNKGFRRFRPQVDTGYNVSYGNGLAELVRIKKPLTKIDVELVNVIAGTDLARQLDMMTELIATQEPGFAAIWLDREKWTNREGHYQKLVLDPRVRVEYPPGVTRKSYRWKFIAPSEA